MKYPQVMLPPLYGLVYDIFKQSFVHQPLLFPHPFFSQSKDFVLDEHFTNKFKKQYLTKYRQEDWGKEAEGDDNSRNSSPDEECERCVTFW